LLILFSSLTLIRIAWKVESGLYGHKFYFALFAILFFVAMNTSAEAAEAVVVVFVACRWRWLVSSFRE
jgi:hypothetical protein